MNSHWLLGGDAVNAGETGDASLKSTSSPWAGGLFQARFQHDAAADDDDASPFSFGTSPFGVAWEVEMKGDDSLCRDLWEVKVVGRGSN